jgi:hypothetical protein
MTPQSRIPQLTRSLSLTSKSHPFRILAASAGILLLFSAIALPSHAQTPTMLVLRAVPAKTKKGDNANANTPLAPLVKEDISEIKIGGKTAPVTAFDPLLKGPHNLQLMVLLDSMQQIGSSPGQFDDLKQFFHDLPSNVEIGVGWMLQGKVKVVQTFTTDHDLAGKALIAKSREEAASTKNDNGNPFRCLADLAAHWPDNDPAKLRAVLMFTDGIIRNNSAGQDSLDQMNPDVEAASNNLQRSGIIPYPFFYLDVVIPDPSRSEGGQLEGQQNFSQLDQSTGGAGLYEGMFAPGSFSPLLNRLYTIFQSEAVVTVAAPYPPGKFQRLDLKTSRSDISLGGPDNVTVGNVLGKK